MAREQRENTALKKLKADLSARTPGSAYLFYGIEAYQRGYYLEQLRKVLVDKSFEQFNYHRLEGKELLIEDLASAVETMPMMAERTLVVVVDLDIFKLGANQREALIALLEDIPPYCCLVFVYDTIEYAPNRTMKKLCKALDGHVQAVEFRQADTSSLLDWVRRRFQALGKDIGRAAAEHLIFTCGPLMTGLVQEIDKIASYTEGAAVTEADIDAVADPVLSASAFKMADAAAAGDYDRAAGLLGDLLKMQTEPVLILGALGGQLRRIYTARMALDSGKDKYWLMDIWGYSSDYQVRMLLSAAKKVSLDWCAGAVKQCQVLDRRMKSERGFDGGDGLKLLLARLGAERG